MKFDFTAIHLGTLVLAFIAGLAVMTMSKSWLGRILILAALAGMVVMGITNGPSDPMSNLTSNLINSFFFEPFGLVGAVLGILVGMGFRRRI